MVLVENWFVAVPNFAVSSHSASNFNQQLSENWDEPTSLILDVLISTLNCHGIKDCEVTPLKRTIFLSVERIIDLAASTGFFSAQARGLCYVDERFRCHEVTPLLLLLANAKGKNF
jgi:hypothetical protein